MKKLLFLLFFLLFIILLGGCGSSSEHRSAVFDAKAYIKEPLKNAVVKIYKRENNATVLLYEENTSSNGEFYTHKEDLKDDVFYIYTVKGGNIADEHNTKNQGEIRAIVKGAWLKDAEQLNVSAASQILYILGGHYLFYDIEKLEKVLNTQAKKIIKKDINNDGVIDAKDVLVFDPKNKDEWMFLEERVNNIRDKIIKNDTGYLDLITNDTIAEYKALGQTTEFYVSDKDNLLFTIYLFNFVKTPFWDFNIYDIKDKMHPKKLYSKRFSAYADQSRIEDFHLFHKSKIVMIKGLEFNGKAKGVLLLDYSDLSDVHIITPPQKDIPGYPYLYIGAKFHHLGEMIDFIISPDDQYTYILKSDHNLTVVDNSNLHDLKAMASLELNESAKKIFLNDGEKKLYVINNRTIDIVDIKDPYHPFVSKTVFLESGIKRALFFDDYRRVVIQKSDKEIEIVNMEDLSAPFAEGEIKSEDLVSDLCLSFDEKILYTDIVSKKMIGVYDISKPQKIKRTKRLRVIEYTKITKDSSYNKMQLSKYGLFLLLESKLNLIDANPTENSTVMFRKLPISSKIYDVDLLKDGSLLGWTYPGWHDKRTLFLYKIYEDKNLFLESSAKFVHLGYDELKNQPLIKKIQDDIKIVGNKIFANHNKNGFYEPISGSSVWEEMIVDDKLYAFSYNRETECCKMYNDTYYCHYMLRLGVYDIEESDSILKKYFESCDVTFGKFILSSDKSKLYMFNGLGILVFDLKGEKIKLIGSLDFEKGFVYDIKISEDGRYITLLLRDTKLTIDVSNPSKPFIVHKFKIDPSSVKKISVDAKRIYLLTYEGLDIYRAKDMKLLSHIHLGFSSQKLNILSHLDIAVIKAKGYIYLLDLKGLDL